MQKELQKFRQVVLNLAGSHPRLFSVMYRLWGKNETLLVDADTDLVIEGYPRSGNTFAVVAFQFAQHSENLIKIGHHLHAPAQLYLACKYQIPAMVIIRPPIDTIPSLVVRESHVTVTAALKRYLVFHSAVAACRKHLLLVQFESVTRDFGQVMRAFNSRFSTSYIEFPHTEQNVKAVFSQIDSLETGVKSKKVRKAMVSRPSDARKPLIEAARSELALPANKELLTECELLYQNLLSDIDC